jgi:ABC-2 type transport system permease protein
VEQLGPLRAIVWAQWATSRNFYMRANKGGLVLKWLMGLLWYGMWALGAVGAGYVVSGRVPMGIVERALPGALFLVFFFWQLFPIILASQGAFLDMRRLLVYPIPESQMFALEVALRVTTAIEMLLVCIGLMVGLWCNPEVRVWAPLVIVVFILFNLFLATGVKALMERWFKKKGVRELMMVGFLALILVPQLFAAGLQEGVPNQFAFLEKFAVVMRVTPWIAVGALALGKGGGLAVASLTVSTGLAYLFARLQFARSLRLEEGEGDGPRKAEKAESTWFDAVVRWPGVVLLDPVAAVVEKDLRTLTRSPRFRLIFMMASTFGAVLWLPQALRSKGGWMANNYITMAALYGILVLGEVLYWNVFGFERAGAQQWFVTPVGFRDVLRAKNMVAIFFTVLTIAILSAIAMVLPIGAGVAQVADAMAAAAVFLVAAMGGGNLTSVYMPRPIDADQAWRNNASKTQFMLMLAYPVLTIPVVMAHLARWATDNYWAYHGVLAVAFVVALCFYHVATETAVEVAEARKENIVEALSRTDGPVSIST